MNRKAAPSIIYTTLAAVLLLVLYEAANAFIFTGQWHSRLISILLCAAIAAVILELIARRRTRARGGGFEIDGPADRKDDAHKELAFLQRLIDTIPNPVFYKDLQGRYLGCNKAFAEFFGVDGRAIIGRTIHDIAPPEFADSAVTRDRSIGDDREIMMYESSVRHADGSMRNVVFNKAAFTQGSGELAGIVGVLVDVTAYRKTEEMLRASEERYRTLIHDINEYVYRVEYRGGVVVSTYHSPRCRDITGYTPEEYAADQDLWYRMVHEDDRERVAQFFNDIMNNLNPPPIEHRIIHKDGSIRWISNTSTAVADAVGKIIHLDGFILDITRRKQAEEALRESEERYRALVENVNDVIYTLDMEGRFTYVSPVIEQFSAYRMKDLIGRSFVDFIHPEDLPGLTESFGRTARGEIEPFEYRIFDKDGSVRYIRTSSRLLVRGGAVSGITGVMTDITERKRVEEELKHYREQLEELVKVRTAQLESANMKLTQEVEERRRAEEELRASEVKHLTVLEASTDAIFLETLDGKILDCNKAACEMYGYTKEEMLSHRVADLVPQELVNDLPGVIVSEIEKGSFFAEVINRRKDGSLFPCELSTRVVVIEGLKLVVAFVRDITERKKAQEKLREAAEELERSNAELERFAYVVSHDLQQPLATAGAYIRRLDRLYSGTLDADAARYLRVAIDEISQMEQMIKGLLDYSRIGIRGVERGLVDCESVLRIALGNLHADIKASGASVTHGPMPQITANELHLMQLFQNLIGNAIKFRGEEPPRVHISARKSGDAWLFSVRDNGIGIEADDTDRIFQIFERIAGGREYSGTGIGLSICKNIVERHNGRIWAESKPGEGSTFYFTIPYGE